MAADEARSRGTDATDEPLQFAEHLCAKLCHDMAGGLGALMGSLELAREQGETAGEAMQLASDAGRALVARLRLLRAAWVGDGAPLGLARLAELAKGLPERRVALDISALAPETVFAPATGRVVLNLILLAAEALPAGGTIWLECTKSDLVVGIAGPRAAWPTGLATALAGEVVPAGPRELQAPLTVRLARATGLPLSLLLAADTEAAPPLVLGLSAGGDAA